MISIIAAVSSEGVIGRGGSIPWDIPEDRAYFRGLTVGNICIMGRATFESIGRPLPNRINIVVSSKENYCGDLLRTVPDLNAALRLAEECVRQSGGGMEIFLCGGERIYSEGLSHADRLYLTELDLSTEGDAFFPEFDKNEFKLISRDRREELSLSLSVYERIK